MALCGPSGKVPTKISDTYLNKIERVTADVRLQVLLIIKKVARRDRAPHMVTRMLSVKLIEERGGIPQGPGECPRPIWAQVRELAVQMDHLAEMIKWNRRLANDVLAGRVHIHLAIMNMLGARGYYDGEFGVLRYQVDVWAQKRIDPRKQ
jgi:hypothetical protein